MTHLPQPKIIYAKVFSWQRKDSRNALNWWFRAERNPNKSGFARNQENLPNGKNEEHSRSGPHPLDPPLLTPRPSKIGVRGRNPSDPPEPSIRDDGSGEGAVP